MSNKRKCVQCGKEFIPGIIDPIMCPSCTNKLRFQMGLRPLTVRDRLMTYEIDTKKCPICNAEKEGYEFVYFSKDDYEYYFEGDGRNSSNMYRFLKKHNLKRGFNTPTYICKKCKGKIGDTYWNGEYYDENKGGWVKV